LGEVKKILTRADKKFLILESLLFQRFLSRLKIFFKRLFSKKFFSGDIPTKK